MAKELSVIIEQDTEGYYVASVPALRGLLLMLRRPPSFQR